MSSKLVDFAVGLCFWFGVVGSLLLFISVHRLGVSGIAVAWAVMLSASSCLVLLLAVAVQRHYGVGAALQACTLPVIGVLSNAFTLLVHAGSLLASQRLFFLGVIVFFLQIDTLPQKNSSRDKHLQNRLSETPCAFGAD